MPGEAANALTATYRRQAALIAEAAAARIARGARRAGLDDVDLWWTSVEETLTDQVLEVAEGLATLTRRYLRGHAAAEGVDVEPAEVPVNVRRIAEALRITGPVAFKTHIRGGGTPETARATMSRTLAGAVKRLVLDAGRDTTMQTYRTNRSIQGWRRVTSAGACAFCQMLRSRGATYSKRSARFRSHDNCACSAEMVYRREAEPDDVKALQQRWDDVTGSRIGPDAVREWQRNLRAEQKNT
ncbi:VG15 protein [Salininema proteolyticum]|uniref:Uncharacterized protein n=1 Tax=Salininema proteolyticum TaxID=1607685 RepID=A0ABV8TWQ2_9ACTN